LRTMPILQRRDFSSVAGRRSGTWETDYEEERIKTKGYRLQAGKRVFSI